MAEICLALIERRIPFVVEKPLGTSLDQLQEVRRAAEEAGVPATVPLIQRGGPADSWLAKAGRPVYQRLSFIAGPPERYDRNGNPWMLDPERAGGGCLANLGPHFVDLFLQRSGQHDRRRRREAVVHPARADGRGPRDPRPDHAGRPRGDHRGGVRVPALAAEALLQLLVRGRGGFRLHRLGRIGLFTTLDGRTERAVIDVDSDPLYDPFVRQVARTLGEGFRGLPTLGELEDVMRIIWRAYEADREGGHHG